MYTDWRMTPPLKGKILVTKSRSERAKEEGLLSAIATVNRELDRLTEPETWQQQQKQHNMIGEAVAQHYGTYRPRLGWPKSPVPGNDETTHNVLCGAIVIGKLELVKALLDSMLPHHALDTESRYFGRPLQIAAAWGHLDIVQHLLNLGANPHAISSRSAFESDNRPGVDYRDRYEAYIYRSSQGSALRAAVLSGHQEIVHLLLQPLFRIDFSTSEFFRCLRAAVKGGHLDLLRQLLNEAGRKLEEQPFAREELLWDAVLHNRVAIVKMLLDIGANVNEDPYNLTISTSSALQLAALQGHDHLIRLLLDHGADMRASWGYSGDALQIAAKRGHEEAVQALIERGADPCVAFNHAARTGQAHLLRYLLDNNSMVAQSIPRVGHNSLKEAILIKNPTIIRMLVEASVPIDQDRDKIPPDEDPVVLAKIYSEDFVVDLLLTLGAKDKELSPRQRLLKPSHANPVFGFRMTRRTWEWAGKY